MPICINLLAESQAAEELRRRDPAKRALWMASVLVGAVLIWSGSLQVKLLSDNGRLARLQDSMSNKANGYAQVMSNAQELAQANAKLDALHSLTTNRFLQANLLNALQRTSVDGIQLTRLRLDQNYIVLPEDQAKHAGNIEKTLLTLEARDSSASPGDATISHFKESIADNPYFRDQRLSTNDILLKNLSASQVDADTGRPFVTFVFECRYPDRVR
jgi:hypothetical protein